MPVSGQQLAHLLSTPHAASSHLPTSAPQPSPAQAHHLSHLVEYFSPASGTSPTLPLSADEQLFLSRETLLRFLTATKNDLSSTKTRLDKCLVWRRSLNLSSNASIASLAAEVAPEAVCGKEFVLGYSKKGQPVLHFLPNRSDTKESERQLRHVVYMLERTADLMPAGVNNLLLIIDFAGKKSAPTSPAMARNFISILQDFYPERLGCAVLLSIPWIVRKFLDIAFTFVDPVTKGKVRWHVDVVKEGLVGAGEALREYGGDVDFVYKQEEYWPLLLATSLAKREQYLANWARLGGGVGVSEWDYKQPVPSSTSGTQPQPQLPRSTQTSSTGNTVAERTYIHSQQPTSATPSPTTTVSHLSPTTATATGTPPSTGSRTESISSESTFHENHGLLDMHALEKGMSGGMVIAEHGGDPAAATAGEQRNEPVFVGVVGV
ncbi:hypothetical protein QFC21_000031 [Naganishia friedmannii]|uniref:Uncharacterized protein n=1 Tax=Naganishia friedmannii TaxID=89922 RepID=A0ACC2WBC3_9TREE|nr:hypothetical protein QFC21_000031 [Naganishia friedmannii]